MYVHRAKTVLNHLSGQVLMTWPWPNFYTPNSLFQVVTRHITHLNFTSAHLFDLIDSSGKQAGESR